MKTLVTGGAGFIGSHLTLSLLAAGHDVVVLDNFVSGRRENLSDAGDSPQLTIVEADITDGDAIRRHFDGVQWVFHLAALADIVPSIERPAEYFRTNVDGTFNVLEAARDAGVERFVYAASGSCYGIPDEEPTSESAEIRPQYPYALTKYLGEQTVMHWSQVYDLPCVSLRLFNVYGPRSRTSGTYGAVFGVFLAQKLAGKPFTVVGDGTQTRDFTFVTDVVDALIAAAASDVSGEVMNVGSGGSHSVNRIVELMDGPSVGVPKRPGEPDSTQADISKIARLLDWRPRVAFDDGVREVIAHIDYWRDAPVWEPESIAKATEQWFSHLGEPATAAQR